MRIRVGRTIQITEPTQEIRAWAESRLVVANPDYYQKQKMGFWVGSTPEKLRFYNYDTNGALEVPFGCFKELYQLHPVQRDYYLVFPERGTAKYAVNVALRDYQHEAVDKCRRARNGVLVAPCGSGKTVMGLCLIAALGQPALWITHTKDLLKQSMDSARETLGLSGAELGTISEGRVQIGSHITFATVQTLAKHPELDNWNVVVVDEAHRAFMSGSSCSMFESVINRLAARYKYGLTATANRSDGLIETMFFLLGDKIHEVPRDCIAEYLMPVDIRFGKTEFTPSDYVFNADDTMNFTALVKEITEDTERNARIVHDIMENCDRHCLVLSDRVRHLQLLQRYLPGVRSEIITGATPVTKRAETLQGMRDKKINVLFATYNLAKEGLDIPCLDRLFLAAPKKNYAVVTQCAGRIARRANGKTDAVVYDYVDAGVGVLMNQYRKRLAAYKKNNYKLQNIIL